MLETHPSPREIIGGVGTHANTHTVAALDELGRLLGHASFPASSVGYSQLLGWLSHGEVMAVGVEGTGSYGAGLARHLTAHGVKVVEVDRPDRRARRKVGKSDPADAVAAARTVQAGCGPAFAPPPPGPIVKHAKATQEDKDRDGPVVRPSRSRPAWQRVRLATRQ